MGKKRKQDGPSQSEEFCRTQFDIWLRRNYPSAVISWEYLSQLQQPPDFYLVMDGEKYAVEVTTVMRKVTIGGIPMSDATTDNYLRNLVLDVAARCHERGILRGTYFVSFPEGVSIFKETKKKLEAAIAEYVLRTQHDESAPAEAIIIDNQMIAEIDKEHTRNDFIYPILSGYGGWESETYKEFCPILKEDVAVKKEKLRSVPQPWILLL